MSEPKLEEDNYITEEVQEDTEITKPKNVQQKRENNNFFDYINNSAKRN